MFDDEIFGNSSIKIPVRDYQRSPGQRPGYYVFHESFPVGEPQKNA